MGQSQLEMKVIVPIIASKASGSFRDIFADSPGRVFLGTSGSPSFGRPCEPKNQPHTGHPLFGSEGQRPSDARRDHVKEEDSHGPFERGIGEGLLINGSHGFQGTQRFALFFSCNVGL